MFASSTDLWIRPWDNVHFNFWLIIGGGEQEAEMLFFHDVTEDVKALKFGSNVMECPW